MSKFLKLNSSPTHIDDEAECTESQSDVRSLSDDLELESENVERSNYRLRSNCKEGTCHFDCSTSIQCTGEKSSVHWPNCEERLDYEERLDCEERLDHEERLDYEETDHITAQFDHHKIFNPMPNDDVISKESSLNSKMPSNYEMPDYVESANTEERFNNGRRSRNSLIKQRLVNKRIWLDKQAELNERNKDVNANYLADLDEWDGQFSDQNDETESISTRSTRSTSTNGPSIRRNKRTIKVTPTVIKSLRSTKSSKTSKTKTSTSKTTVSKSSKTKTTSKPKKAFSDSECESDLNSDLNSLKSDPLKIKNLEINLHKNLKVHFIIFIILSFLTFRFFILTN